MAVRAFSCMGTGRRESDLLTVAEVMARYRLRDRRAARRVMDAAGAFKIGAGLFVRLTDLLDFEDLQRARRGRADTATHIASSTDPLAAPLEPGWWRDDDSSRAA